MHSSADPALIPPLDEPSEKKGSSIFDPTTGEISLSSIRYFVLGEDPDTRRLLSQVDSFLKKELNNSEPETERRLATLFYYIVTKTRLFSVETPEMRKLFRMFVDEMEKQIGIITVGTTGEDIFTGIKKRGFLRQIAGMAEWVEFRLKILENKVRLNQMRAFLFLCEYYVHYLENIYKDLSMSDRVLELYVVRMDIKKSHLFFERKIGAWFGMAFFRSISMYGTSFGRLAVTCSFSIMLFWGIYWLGDYFAPADARMIKDLTDYSSYFFNSLTTISGLGIDASPQTALQRVAMGINTIYGMVVFGMLFNVISTKLSMNS